MAHTGVAGHVPGYSSGYSAPGSMYGTGYPGGGAYGGGAYGGGAYGGGAYGGGAYGGASYGGYGGYGGYGYSMGRYMPGRYGMAGGPYGAGAYGGPSNFLSDNLGWLNTVAGVVGAVSQITELLGMNAEAMHHMFGSVFHLFDRMCEALGFADESLPPQPHPHAPPGMLPPADARFTAANAARRRRFLRWLALMFAVVAIHWLGKRGWRLARRLLASTPARPAVAAAATAPPLVLPQSFSVGGSGWPAAITRPAGSVPLPDNAIAAIARAAAAAAAAAAVSAAGSGDARESAAVPTFGDAAQSGVEVADEVRWDAVPTQ